MMTKLQTRILKLAAGLVLFTTVLPLRAQTNVAKPAPHSDRYLLILETSHAMDKRSDGALKVAQGLLVSGMNGQMQKGDSLGVWTFNQELFTGHLPLQQWSPESQKDVAKRTLNFLKDQKYEKQANLSKVLPTLDRVVKGSACITVILISAGEDYIHGTPFDNEINKAFKSWHQQQKDARMPVVTVLRGRSGKITDYAVTAAPWPVEIPPLQPEKQVAEAAPPKPEPAPQKAPPPPVPPLILSGKKTTPTTIADPPAAELPSADGASKVAKAQSPTQPPATSEKPAATTAPATNASVEGQSPAAPAKIEGAALVPGQLSIEATSRETNQAGATTLNKRDASSENAHVGADSGVAQCGTTAAHAGSDAA